MDPEQAKIIYDVYENAIRDSGKADFDRITKGAPEMILKNAQLGIKGMEIASLNGDECDNIKKYLSVHVPHKTYGGYYVYDDSKSYYHASWLNYKIGQ